MLSGTELSSEQQWNITTINVDILFSLHKLQILYVLLLIVPHNTISYAQLKLKQKNMCDEKAEKEMKYQTCNNITTDEPSIMRG